MTVMNGRTLYAAAPIKNMMDQKIRENGVSYGLSEAGYDIRIKQLVRFVPSSSSSIFSQGFYSTVDGIPEPGKFVLASAIEEFDMPNNLVGIVHDKSTWARLGLSVLNTVIESGWKGFLTLELVYHGSKELIIPAGAGIAQVVFSQTTDRADYGDGKYQNAGDFPQPAMKI
jgi:dCTP deaminase